MGIGDSVGRGDNEKQSLPGLQKSVEFEMPAWDQEHGI